MITWNSSLETGHLMVDNDHKRLIDALNQLEVALKGGQGKDSIPQMIQFLNTYTRDHFKREEEHMRRINCPAYTENCREHAAFKAKLDAWVIKLQAGASTTLVLELHREVVQWIKGHIVNTDCKLRACKTH
ncbi:MAG: hemerythrin family protein [Verrucomicrobiota bacterium]|nr:hemerythrin family protein [Verrucomicrobiota bacterium]